MESEHFEARLTWPLDFSVSPFSFSIPTDAPLEGSFAGDMRLDRLAVLLGLQDQPVKGMLDVDLQFDGTVQDPGITGRILVNEGEYENSRTGTVLSPVHIDISARTPRLQILDARSGDGESGTIRADGWLDIDPQQKFPLHMVIRLEKAKILRLDAAQATLSGTLVLEGPLRGAKLSGRLNMDSADFQIPDRLPDSITEIEVIEINKKESTAQTPRIREKSDIPLGLDIIVVSSGRTFVRGRGLDSEWEGEVRLSGKASQPSITGTVSLVRGRAAFLGKDFSLRRGTITLNGDFPPSPFIDVTAEAEANEITARLDVIGMPSSLEFKLGSSPPLPADEILSRLLFGSSARNISPMQAIQLADALNNLRGGGMDLMGRSRKFLGVDRLSVKKTGEELGDTALSAGKYISEDVYIEVEKGISPESGKASVKWDVTPHITVDSEAGLDAQAGLGVQWKWDY
jgi:autotransporter translocation and assembly factor TamB